jgi:flagellar hook-associated protein 1 FlgK
MERLDQVNASLNDSLGISVENANRLIGDIAKLNEQIVATEVGGVGTANDLRDVRQQRVEELALLVNFTAVEQSTGAVDVVIDGQMLTSGAVVSDQLEAYDPGNGQLLLRTATGGVTLNVTGGEIRGNIDVRDGALASLRDDVNQLASTLITQVNAIHTTGYDLNGNTGQAFFSGTDAGSIGLNSVLHGMPNRVQAAGVMGAPGDNATALRLAQLAESNVGALGNQTLNQFYGQTVAELGQALSSVNSQLANQEIVESMIRRQRDSVSGVSLDEEMTDLIRYQSAFEASARLVTTLDEMLQTLVNLGR